MLHILQLRCWSVRTSVHSVVGIGLNFCHCWGQKGRRCLGHWPKASDCLVRCPCQENSKCCHYALKTPVNWWMSISAESDPLTLSWTGMVCLSSWAPSDRNLDGWCFLSVFVPSSNYLDGRYGLEIAVYFEVCVDLNEDTPTFWWLLSSMCSCGLRPPFCC